MNVAQFILEPTSLSDVYPAAAVATQTKRWTQLLSKFRETYGHAAEFVSRSPGRVNIIGEHIDYMLFSVLPMAVEVDLLLAVRVLPSSSSSSSSSSPTTTEITISNVDPKYPPRKITVPARGHGDIEINLSQGLEWSNYFRAGYRGALEFLRRASPSMPLSDAPPSLEILVSGNVPSGSGLSSSAGFVCASALAGLASMGVTTVDKKELVQLAITSERYVGVNSGGMDQSASVLGQAGSALFISFSPTLEATAVRFPKARPEPVFIIANSRVVSDKFVTGPVNYNLRVVECTLAAQVLAKKLQLGELPTDAGPLGSSLKGLMDVYFSKNPSSESLARRFDEIAQIAAGVLVNDDEGEEEGYTREEMAEILGMGVEELVQTFMARFPVRCERFQLKKRAAHVFGEAARVVLMHDILKAAESKEEEEEEEEEEEKNGEEKKEKEKEEEEGIDGQEVLKKLGALMNASQDSCRDLYACSCAEIEELCTLARGAGAYGSRLTGAGWGGCSVHLVPHDKVEDVKRAWTEGYYRHRFPGMTEGEMDEAVVVSRPGHGAVLVRVKDGQLGG